jgi:aminoglycoside phosphotransferase (APT) family kinase protein
VSKLSVQGRAPSTSAHDDVARVVADLESVLGAEGAPVEVLSIVPFGDGHSGLTFRIELRGIPDVESCIVRLSPDGVRLVGPADIGRQGRIMAAIGAAGVPAPRVLACDSEGTVDGHAFAVTELVSGTSWEVVARQRSHEFVARQAVDVLIRLQRLPVELTGLAGEPVNTPEDDLARWAPLLERGVPEYRDAGAPLLAALRRAIPVPAEPVLVHGDFHYGNLLFANGQVVAIVDWEIAQLGDPLLDLGCLAVASLRRRYAPEPNPTGDVEIPLRTLVDAYGTTPERASWFFALTCLKYAAILSYNLKLHRSGKRLDPIYEALTGTASGLIEDGCRLIEDGIDAFADEERAPA